MLQKWGEFKDVKEYRRIFSTGRHEGPFVFLVAGKRKLFIFRKLEYFPAIPYFLGFLKQDSLSSMITIVIPIPVMTLTTHFLIFRLWLAYISIQWYFLDRAIHI